MKTETLPGEEIIKEGGANLQRGLETVGGRLFLTNQRLVFESHAFNLQTGATIIPLADISETMPCWTRFLNLIPVTPNSLAVSTSEDQQHRFVLSGRTEWKTAIDTQKDQNAALDERITHPD
jgi:hypothetical protein